MDNVVPRTFTGNSLRSFFRQVLFFFFLFGQLQNREQQEIWLRRKRQWHLRWMNPLFTIENAHYLLPLDTRDSTIVISRFRMDLNKMKRKKSISWSEYSLGLNNEWKKKSLFLSRFCVFYRQISNSREISHNPRQKWNKNNHSTKLSWFHRE